MSDQNGMNDVTDSKVISLLQAALDRGIITRDQVSKAIKQKGRAAPSLPEFTFPGSGITVRVRRLGPFTLDAIRSRSRLDEPPPDAPKRMVNYGTEESPEWKMEENLADPEYTKALREYEEKMKSVGAIKIIDTIIEHAVVVDVDEEEVSSARTLLISLGVPKEEVDAISDHMIYIKHVCVKTGNDLAFLQRFVIGESMPTEERVQAHEDNFRSNIPTTTDQTLHRPVIGDEL